MRIECPHCHRRIEVVELEAAAPIICDSCGSSIRYEDQSTGTWSPTDLARQIGRFELRRVAGEGTFGSVFLARDPKLEREVALKVPRFSALGDQRHLERFLRESRSIAQLSHPSIVPIFEVGEVNGLPFLVSEFIHGETLSDRMRRQRFTPVEAAELVIEVAEALGYAHKQGVIHRDIKPTNIMIDWQGKVRLMDFGLAKRDGAEITITIDGQILGTPAYMCPEQASGQSREVTAAGDVYSAGIVLYELLTGKLPFTGQKESILEQVLHCEPQRPRKIDANVPLDLESICLKAIEKNPRRRYQDGDELASDLRRFLKGEPTLARPIPRRVRAARWLRRRPLHVALGAVTVFSLLAISALSVAYYQRAPITPKPVYRVHLDSNPPGARLIAVPLSDNTGEPIPNKAVRPRNELRTPLTLDMPSGIYLVVAEIEGFGFAEVMRTVPRDPRMPHTKQNCARWDTLPNNELSLPTIQICERRSAVTGMVPFDGGEFISGDSELQGVPLHTRKLEPFFLDAVETSVSDFRRWQPAMELLHGDLREDEAVRRVSYHNALDYAEFVGKRLPTEFEYEFAATNGGTTRFPWGNDPKDVDEWKFDGPPAYDQTPTNPPVQGLYSNVAEWTTSWVTAAHPTQPDVPFPETLNMHVPEMLKIQQQNLRILRGVPGDFDFEILMGGKKKPTRLSPQIRIGVRGEDRIPGVGFRCAASLRPRFLD